MSDLIVYGASCVWWDSIDKASSRMLSTREVTPRLAAHSIPCCPHCQSVLYQMPESTWWHHIDRYEKDGHPGYRAFIEWYRGKCFRTIAEARTAYTRETLKTIQL